MKISLTILFLPFALGGYTTCSDNSVCPEGTKCCTTYEDKIRCCDVNNTNSIYIRTSKPLRVVPSTPFHSFRNSSQQIALYGSCIEGINCDGTCCEDQCCPHSDATCCDGGCCSFYSKCCSGYTKYIVMKRWCCIKGDKCGDYEDEKCLDKGSFLKPYFIGIVFTAAMTIFLA